MKQTLLKLLKERGYNSNTQNNTILFSNDSYSIALSFTKYNFDMIVTLIPSCSNTKSLIVPFKHLSLDLNELRLTLIDITNSMDSSSINYSPSDLNPISYLDYKALRCCYNDLSKLIEDYLTNTFLKLCI